MSEKARVLVAGASGFTGALAAQIVWRHPRLELVGVTSRSDAGTRLDRLYPALPGAAGADRARPRCARGRRRGDRRLPARRLGADRRRAARRSARSSSTSPPTSGCATCRPTSAGTGEHGAPELLDGAVYGLTELYREQLREAELVATPGCYPTAGVLALAPLAERGLLTDVVIDAKQGVSGAGRGGGDAMHYVSMDENAFAYETDGHRHMPEIEQELAALGSETPVTFVPHLLPLDQGELTSCYARLSEPISKEEVPASTPSATPASPSSTPSTGRPGCATCAIPTVPRLRHGRGARPRARLSAIDNLWKGAWARRSRTST